MAEGIIRMDGVLQKSADMNVELTESAKNGRSGLPVATLRAIQVTSSPVDQDNKNNNSVLISGTAGLPGRQTPVVICELALQTVELATSIPTRTRSRNSAPTKTTMMDSRATQPSADMPRSAIITGNWSEMKTTRRRTRIWAALRSTATVISR